MTKLYTSSVINASREKIWATIRNFNGLPNWHPAIVVSKIEGGLASDQLGCIRNFNTADGGLIREQLLALSDKDYAFTYSILESPMGVDNYVATVELFEITNGGGTFAVWTAEFDCAPEKEAELIQFIGHDVFQGGFDALEEKLGK